MALEKAPELVFGGNTGSDTAEQSLSEKLMRAKGGEDDSGEVVLCRETDIRTRDGEYT